MIRKVVRGIWEGLRAGWNEVKDFAPVLLVMTAGMILVWSSATNGVCK